MVIPWEKVINHSIEKIKYYRRSDFMSHIYKIVNTINNKVYIGYTSQTIQKRFIQHCSDAKINKDNSILHQAMRKYGRENFLIESLYEFDEKVEEWQNLEKSYILQYDSLAPNGYNILEGGEQPPVAKGNDNNQTKYPDEKMPELFNMLKDTSISYKEIARRTGLTVGYLYLINEGKFRQDPSIIYPLRRYNQYEERALKIMNILSTDKTLSNSKIAQIFGIRPNEVASINHGKQYKYLWDGDFPIRNVLVPDDYEKKQQLAKKVIEFKNKNPMVTKKFLQEKFNVSRSVMDKIYNSIYPYDLNT